MADGCTSTGVSCLCILFILNATSTLHVLITHTTNLVTPAYPFNTLIYSFKVDGKNEKSLKMFSSFFLLLKLMPSKMKDRIMPSPKTQCKTLRTTLFSYSQEVNTRKPRTFDFNFSPHSFAFPRHTEITALNRAPRNGSADR